MRRWKMGGPNRPAVVWRVGARRQNRSKSLFTFCTLFHFFPFQFQDTDSTSLYFTDSWKSYTCRQFNQSQKSIQCYHIETEANQVRSLKSMSKLIGLVVQRCRVSSLLPRWFKVVLLPPESCHCLNWVWGSGVSFNRCFANLGGKSHFSFQVRNDISILGKSHFHFRWLNADNVSCWPSWMGW